ncbi:MAG: hypothetical protein ABI379_11765 [Rhodanobacter sp.]
MVMLTYANSLDAIDAALDAKASSLDRRHAAGIFVASGRQMPRTGRVILASGCDRGSSTGALAEVAIKRDGLARCEVTGFVSGEIGAGCKPFASRPAV